MNTVDSKHTPLRKTISRIENNALGFRIVYERQGFRASFFDFLAEDLTEIKEVSVGYENRVVELERTLNGMVNLFNKEQLNILIVALADYYLREDKEKRTGYKDRQGVQDVLQKFFLELDSQDGVFENEMILKFKEAQRLLKTDSVNNYYTLKDRVKELEEAYDALKTTNVDLAKEVADLEERNKKLVESLESIAALHRYISGMSPVWNEGYRCGIMKAREISSEALKQ
jgi:hypothetical protein